MQIGETEVHGECSHLATVPTDVPGVQATCAHAPMWLHQSHVFINGGGGVVVVVLIIRPAAEQRRRNERERRGAKLPMIFHLE